MAILNQALVEGASVVARAVQLVVRTETVAAPTNTSAPSSQPLPTTPADPAVGGQPQGSSASGTSSPLLFFVALGFGVVFTNLWIIVGVKYCFRYNARNRQLRGLDDNGEPINLDNMPTRPHRRRREKKLMSMDEVNAKFPMMKYKTWVADRAREGLPTAGGVSTPPSRTNSLKIGEIVPDLPSKERDELMIHSSEKPGADGKETVETGTTLTHTQTAASILTKDPDHGHGSDEEDDDEQINASVGPEVLVTPGDTCAICIDSLEDDDDVRGLTCGHAFHAVCLDPWLTNRRACCPLCKADYYTPKPRPALVDADVSHPAAAGVYPVRNHSHVNMPRGPQRTWTMRARARADMTRAAPRQAPAQQPSGPLSWIMARRHQTTGRPDPRDAHADATEGLLARVRGRLPQLGVLQRALGDRRNNNAPQNNNASAPETSNMINPPTPSQLEAGSRT